jgi:ankyrin repeat protein
MAIQLAAKQGDIAIVRGLIAEGCDPNVFDILGHTPLHYAAGGEHFEVVKFLLASGACVDARNSSSFGDTPLGFAVRKCSREMAELLVKAGATPTIPGHMRITAIQRAQVRNDGDGPAIYKLLCQIVDHREG